MTQGITNEDHPAVSDLNSVQPAQVMNNINIKQVMFC